MYNKMKLAQEISKEKGISFNIPTEVQIANVVTMALLFELEKEDIYRMLEKENVLDMQLYIFHSLCPCLSEVKEPDAEKAAVSIRNILQKVKLPEEKKPDSEEEEKPEQQADQTKEELTGQLHKAEEHLSGQMEKTKKIILKQIKELQEEMKNCVAEEISRLPHPEKEEPEKEEENPEEPTNAKEYLQYVMFHKFSGFSAAQVKTLRSLKEGELTLEAVKAVARPENDVNKMQEMIQFFASKNGKGE